MNIAATHSYNAEPDILIDVPSGITKLQILLETPARFSTHSIVTGSVADEELVEKAVTSAGPMALKCSHGFTLATVLSNSGKPMNIKMLKPTMTVMKKTAKERNESNPEVANDLATRQNTPMGKNFMITSVIAKVVWKIPCQKPIKID